MSSDLITVWLWAFARTNLVEVPLYVWLGRKAGLSPKAAALVAVTANCLTHPALWFLAPRWEPYAAWIVTMELAIILFEAAWFRAWFRRSLRARQAFAMSFFANLASAVTWPLIRQILY